MLILIIMGECCTVRDPLLVASMMMTTMIGIESLAEIIRATKVGLVQITIVLLRDTMTASMMMMIMTTAITEATITTITETTITTIKTITTITTITIVTGTTIITITTIIITAATTT